MSTAARTKPRPNRVVTIAAAAALGVLAAPARAETVPLDSLPEASVPAPDLKAEQQAPKTIPAGEKVDGVYAAVTPPSVVARSEAEGYATYANATLFTDAEQAKQFADTGEMHPPARSADGADEGACLSRGGAHASTISVPVFLPPRPDTPDSTARRQRLARMTPDQREEANYIASNYPPRVVAARLERFREGADGAATLELVDVWFDTGTLGVRSRGRSTVPFRRVAASACAPAVYAARSGAKLTFLVAAPRIPEAILAAPDAKTRGRALRSLERSMVAQLPGGAQARASDSQCGLLRVELDGKVDGGQMASVLATAFLPPERDPDAPPEAKAAAKRGDDDDDDDDARAREARERAASVRVRPLVAHLSVSQLPSESAPIVSVSYAWAGPDHEQRF